MHGYSFKFCATTLTALANGLLWWPDRRLLCASDLHLGKSDRIARLGGTLLPPYENRDTLSRLAIAIDALDPLSVICLGDSFDDLAGQDALAETDYTTLTAMMAGRRWIWIEGNHDAGPINLGGSHQAEYATGNLTFRHIASKQVKGQISGHYHPKATVSLKSTSITRPCFLIDQDRVILPAFGAYTGGLKTTDSTLCDLMSTKTVAVLLGSQAMPVPMPRQNDQQS
jgi:DNA ligase-associated metallophosphoesterase